MTFSGLGSVPWLASNGSVNVTVERIPDQYPLSAPQVVLSQTMSTSGGSITVPVTFQASHDAFAIYLTPGRDRGGFPSGYHRLVVGNDGLCVDVFGNIPRPGRRSTSGPATASPTSSSSSCRSPAATASCRRRTPARTWRCPAASSAAGVPDIVQQAPQRRVGQPVAAGAAVRRLLAVQEPGSGLCLDVYGAGSNPGQQLDQWPCKNAPGTNQDFTPH